MTLTRLLLALALVGVGLAQSAPPLPECRYDDVPAVHQSYDAWAVTLLDPIHQLPPDYVPPDLAPLREAGLPSDLQVRRVVLPDLRALLEAAAAAGHALEVQSAYRSHGYQARTFEGWVTRLGREAALKSSARPGHSEHQLGTALDFRSALGPAPWDIPDWAATPAGAWLAKNAHRYGFVMSYPKGSEAVSCYSYEPWHYRYVGRETAQAVQDSGLSLREWLWGRQ